MIFKAPELAHDIETGKQRGWRGNQHVLLDGLLEQRFVGLECLDECGLDGHEHEYHLRRVQPR
ncbi:hypothetical protein D3C78_1939980 [compost metagenome]